MQQSFPSKRRRSASEIRELVVRFHQSGLSRAEFVRNEGICLATLGSYLKRAATASAHGRRSEPTRFLELESGTFPSASGGPPVIYRLCLKGGPVLEIPTGFSRDELKVLLSVLCLARVR